MDLEIRSVDIQRFPIRQPVQLCIDTVKPAHNGQIRSHEKLTVRSRWPLRTPETYGFFFQQMVIILMSFSFIIISLLRLIHER